MDKIKTLLGVLIFLFSSIVNAGIINTEWEIDGLYQFDFQTRSYETPTVPTKFNLSISFPDVVTRSVDYGQESITYFGEIGETEFQSPLTEYIGEDPFGLGLHDQTAYTFPNVSDYPSGFVEEFAAQSNSYSQSGNQFWAYHIGLRVKRYDSTHGGTGNADYSFTSNSLDAFLNDIMINPDDYQFSFNESWQIYDIDTREYLEGKSWSSYNQSISLINISTVSEPSILAIMFTGLFGLGLARRKVMPS